MLNQVLHEIENSQGPITIRELSRKLAIDPNVLEGMIQFWVRKGRITSDEDLSSGENALCSKSCSGTSDCVYITKMPKTFSVPSKSNK